MNHKDHVNLQIWRGAEPKDPDYVLEGTGKGMRHIRFEDAKDVKKGVVSKFIEQAVKLDEQ